MKASINQLAKTSQTPVFKVVIHKLGANPKQAASSPKRDKTFSQARATREDHGTRQMKTTLNSEMLFRLCGHLSP